MRLSLKKFKSIFGILLLVFIFSACSDSHKRHDGPLIANGLPNPDDSSQGNKDDDAEAADSGCLIENHAMVSFTCAKFIGKIIGQRSNICAGANGTFLKDCAGYTDGSQCIGSSDNLGQIIFYQATEDECNRIKLHPLLSTISFTFSE